MLVYGVFSGLAQFLLEINSDRPANGLWPVGWTVNIMMVIPILWRTEKMPVKPWHHVIWSELNLDVAEVRYDLRPVCHCGYAFSLITLAFPGWGQWRVARPYEGHPLELLLPSCLASVWLGLDILGLSLNTQWLESPVFGNKHGGEYAACGSGGTQCIRLHGMQGVPC